MRLERRESGACGESAQGGEMRGEWSGRGVLEIFSIKNLSILIFLDFFAGKVVKSYPP